jgi:hypothetical protein
MSKVEEIESAIQKLSREEMEEIRDWLENVLEDQLTLREDFVARIEKSEAEMAQGKRPRTSVL